MSNAASSPLAPTKPQRAVGLGCAVLFGGFFALVGLAAFWFVTARPLLRSAASAAWVEAPGVILSSELESKSDSDGTTYRVAIRYRYEWGGREFESDRYNFSTGYPNIGVGGMRDIVREHYVGRGVICRVDPDDPASSVIDRSVPAATWFGALTLFFPVFGFGFIWMAWRGSRKGTSAPGVAGGPGAAVSPGVPAAGEVVLKPVVGRIGAFLGLTFVALFWNGIVSVFVVQAAKEFGRGFLGWFLPLFLVPFVLIGLLLLVLTVQAFSRLFAPPVELRLDPSLLRVGARVPIRWRLGGRGVRKLTLRLVCREEATYRQGTTTSTDKSDCHRATVYESTDRLALAESRAELEFPAAAAPTFASANNKLVWELVFDGEIPWRADVDDRFVLPVLAPAAPPAPPAATEPAPHAGNGFTLWTVERFAPGETLVGTLTRDPAAPTAAAVAPAAEGPLTLRLGWFTEGRATSDAAIVWTRVLAGLAPGAEHSFEIPLPAEPWSFSGKLVSVRWRLEVLNARDELLVAVPLVIAPGGEAVALPALAPEPNAFQKRKARYLARKGG